MTSTFLLFSRQKTFFFGPFCCRCCFRWMDFWMSKWNPLSRDGFEAAISRDSFQYTNTRGWFLERKCVTMWYMANDSTVHWHDTFARTLWIKSSKHTHTHSRKQNICPDTRKLANTQISDLSMERRPMMKAKERNETNNNIIFKSSSGYWRQRWRHTYNHHSPHFTPFKRFDSKFFFSFRFRLCLAYIFLYWNVIVVFFICTWSLLILNLLENSEKLKLLQLCFCFIFVCKEFRWFQISGVFLFKKAENKKKTLIEAKPSTWMNSDYIFLNNFRARHRFPIIA